MSFFSRKNLKKLSSSNLPPSDGLASQSQATPQSHSHSPQERQQSQLVYPWSAHAPLGQSPSPFPRYGHALSTTATAAGQLFLFGGYRNSSTRNDLYVFSTRDFSTTLLHTSGDSPNPRAGHGVALTSTVLVIWGGITSFVSKNASNRVLDDSFYLLNLVSREWSRVLVNGPGPGGRYYHTMTLVGSKLFVFGGEVTKRRFNDIWAFDLNCIKSNPLWESYEPAPGDRKPLLRGGHVSVTTGDRIIIFGGGNYPQWYNDTWSFDISTRKWTELQCTGSIPSPRAGHGAVLVDDLMYVFGGRAVDGTNLGDLIALNLSTQRWIALQDVGPSPSGRWAHAMGSDGTRVFVLGGILPAGTQADKAKLIHVLETKRIKSLEPDSSAVNPSENTTQVARKSSVGATQDQPQHPTFSSPNAEAAHSASFRTATPEELGRPSSPLTTHEGNPSPDGLPPHPTGVNGKQRRVLDNDNDGEGSTEYLAKFAAPGASSQGEVARLEDERLADFERQLSETVAAKTERDRRIAQLTDELALKSVLLEQAEANAAEARKHSGLELRELQAKLDQMQLSRDHALEQAQSALRKAVSHATDADEWSQPACGHETELTEVRAELEASKSELTAVRLRLADAENGWAKSKAEADTLGVQTAAGPVNIDEARVTHRLMERMRAMEAEMASRRWNEKSIESMEHRNEG